MVESRHNSCVVHGTMNSSNPPLPAFSHALPRAKQGRRQGNAAGIRRRSLFDARVIWPGPFGDKERQGPSSPLSFDVRFCTLICAMSNDANHPAVDVEFIRLFFREPDEEEIAHRWASRLGRLFGSRAMELRPETTLSEMLEWGAASQVESIDFVVVFEPELRMEFAEFLDDPDHSTFRGMVWHCAERTRPSA